MYHDVSHLLSCSSTGSLPLRQIYLPAPSGLPAPWNWRTSGISAAGDCAEGDSALLPCQFHSLVMFHVPVVLEYPAVGKRPSYHLSILFGKQQLGFSVSTGMVSIKTSRNNTLRAGGPRIGSSCYKTLMRCKMAARAKANGQIDCRQPYCHYAAIRSAAKSRPPPAAARFW